MAGRPPENGRRIFADRLLLWIFHCCGPELHRWRAIRLARDVSLRPLSSDHPCPYHDACQRAGTVEEERRRASPSRITCSNFFGRVSPENYRQCSTAYGGNHWSVGWSGLRTYIDYYPGEKSRHVAGAGVKDRVSGNSDSFYRNNPGLPDGAQVSGTFGEKENSGDLFCRHEPVHLAEFRLGILSGQRFEHIYHLSIFSGIFWREFYVVQLVASRAV